MDEQEDDSMTLDEEVEVIEWAPSIFRTIRKMDKITPKMIKLSLDTSANSK